MPVRILSGGTTQAAAGVPVFIQDTQPSGLSSPALWVPLNKDQTPKLVQDFQVFVPEFNPGVPLSAVFAWYSAPAISDKVNSDTVGQWSDLSGNGRHLVQSTVSKRPVYMTSMQNGQPVLRFTEANLTALGRASLTLPQPFEMFMVFRVRTDANTAKTNFVQTPQGFRWVAAAGGGSRGTELEFGNTMGGSSTNAPLSWNAWRTVVNGATSRIFRTSADTASGGPSNAGANALTQINLGSVPGLVTDIDWGELVITNRLLTTQERADLGTHLTSVWATP